jgi:hypothetical protein
MPNTIFVLAHRGSHSNASLVYIYALLHRGSHSNASLVYIYALLQVPYSHRDVRRPTFTFTNVLNLLLLTGCPMSILTADVVC